MTVTPDELGATTRYLPLTAVRSDYFNDQTPRWTASSNRGNCLDAGLLHVNGTYRFAARDALTESALIVTYRNV